MDEDRKLKYRSIGQLHALIEYCAKRDRWDEVEEYAQELRLRREEHLSKQAS